MEREKGQRGLQERGEKGVFLRRKGKKEETDHIKKNLIREEKEKTDKHATISE